MLQQNILDYLQEDGIKYLEQGGFFSPTWLITSVNISLSSIFINCDNSSLGRRIWRPFTLLEVSGCTAKVNYKICTESGHKKHGSICSKILKIVSDSL